MHQYVIYDTEKTTPRKGPKRINLDDPDPKKGKDKDKYAPPTSLVVHLSKIDMPELQPKPEFRPERLSLRPPAPLLRAHSEVQSKKDAERLQREREQERAREQERDRERAKELEKMKAKTNTTGTKEMVAASHGFSRAPRSCAFQTTPTAISMPATMMNG